MKALAEIQVIPIRVGVSVRKEVIQAHLHHEFCRGFFTHSDSILPQTKPFAENLPKGLWT